ncbi:hypothetical protein CspeluHIS016_0604110 [Cutaneotrichosporon spelunceum]|uniref:Uncharacterized protein n=1 Tax=Cutaneotrichosporon spelunceum TaxID=1672016 RepID=A0AAD3TYP4_9TREE|nr:hypothetical protein CspeluHIS016_0604110 [Cutaneotrichosporon spelunceum]
MPPKGKRRRSASPSAGARTEPPASSSKRSRLNDGSASDVGSRIQVVYELVGSDKKCTRTMTDRSLDDAVLGVARGLGISFLGLRFTHVRTTGVETDVWDDFDFRTIRERALAQGSHSEVIRVYSGALGRAPAPSRATSFSPAAVTGHDPRATESAPATVMQHGSGMAPTPRSAMRSPSDVTPRSQKHVVLALPSDTPPATPSPAPESSNTSRRRRNQRKKSLEHKAISPEPSRLSRVESVVAKHKPARPSPLGQSPAQTPKTTGKGKAPQQPSSKRSKLNPAPPIGEVSPVVGTLPPTIDTVSHTESSALPSIPPTTSAYWTELIQRSRDHLGRQANSSAGTATLATPVALANGSVEAAPQQSSVTATQPTEQPVEELVKTRTKSGPKPKAGGAEPPNRPITRPRNVVPGETEPSAQSAASPEVEPTVPTKRGPGRPRKVSGAAAGPPVAETLAPKKRGRPTKAEVAEREAKKAAEAERLAKEAAESKGPATRGRKGKAAEQKSPSDDESAEPVPARRGPGRPPKAKQVEQPAKGPARLGPPPPKAKPSESEPEESADDESSDEESSESSDGGSSESESSDSEPEETEAEAAVAERPAKPGPGRAGRASKAATDNPQASVAPKAPGQWSTSAIPAAAEEPDTAMPATAIEEAIPEDDAMEVDEPSAVATNGHAADDVEIEDVDDERTPQPNEDGAVSDLDTSPAGERGTSVALLEPEACPLCEQAADHAPKDCPVVLGGVGRVRERMEQRRKQLIAAGIKPLIKSDATLDSCKQWITRLTKVADKVVNGTPQKPSPVKSKSVQATPIATVKAAPKPAHNAAPTKTTPSSTPTSAGPTPKPITAAKRFAAANGAKLLATPKDASDSESSDDEMTPSAPANGLPTTPDTPFYPQSLHLMAAARAGRRTGSSRLSVSDAVIETGDSSDSDSSSSGSGSGSQSESSSGSDISDSDSDSDSDSSGSGSNIDSEALLRQIMTQPLSQRQRAEAARTAASMHVVTQEDIAEASDATDSDDEIVVTRATQRSGSESSIGDFVDGEDGSANSANIDDEDSDAETKSRLLTQVAVTSKTEFVAPAVPEMMDVDDNGAASEEEEERYSEDDIHAKTHVTPRRPPSPLSLDSSRSFSRLAAPSPALDDLPGALALREAIRDDVAPVLDGSAGEDLAATQVNMRASSSGLSPIKSSPIRDSSLTPASHSNEDEDKDEEPKSPTPAPPKRRGRPPKSAALPSSQPLRRSARQLSREPEPPASQPVRRLSRSSSSRDPSPQRITRSTSNSAAVLSPQPTVLRKSTRLSLLEMSDGEDADEEGDDDDDAAPPSGQKRKGFPSSVAGPTSELSPPPSSGHSPSSSIDASQSIPVPATQSSPLRRHTRGDPQMPLFMTQPSQMPATQAYHSIPLPLFPETQEQERSRSDSEPVSDSDANSDAGSAHSSHTSSSEHSGAPDSDGSVGNDSFPALPTMRPSSQAVPMASSFPTLSSLPKELLRQGVDGVQSVWNRVKGSKEETTPDSSDDDSSDDDSSEEEEVPEQIRGRIAGGSRSAKKPRTRGVMRGW